MSASTGVLGYIHVIERCLRSFFSDVVFLHIPLLLSSHLERFHVRAISSHFKFQLYLICSEAFSRRPIHSMGQAQITTEISSEWE